MDQGAPDSDQVVTLEQLAAGEAGPDEAGRARRLLEDMPPPEMPSAMLVRSPDDLVEQRPSK